MASPHHLKNMKDLKKLILATIEKLVAGIINSLQALLYPDTSHRGYLSVSEEYVFHQPLLPVINYEILIQRYYIPSIIYLCIYHLSVIYHLSTYLSIIYYLSAYLSYLSSIHRTYHLSYLSVTLQWQ